MYRSWWHYPECMRQRQRTDAYARHHLAATAAAAFEPHANAAAILGDELDAGRFERALDGFERLLRKPPTVSFKVHDS